MEEAYSQARDEWLEVTVSKVDGRLVNHTDTSSQS